MYCRNCAHQVNDKAIACPNCGVNPRSEKNFCPACGAATTRNQVICTACGVSLAGTSPLSFDTSKLQNIDTSALLKNKSAISAGVAIIGFFMTWVSFKASMMGMGGSKGFSGSNLSELTDTPQINTILIPALLYLFPLAHAGIILSSFMPQFTKYQKIFCLATLILIVYAGIGIFTTKLNLGEMGGMMGAVMQGAAEKTNMAFSAGYGFYLSLAATLATAYFSGFGPQSFANNTSGSESIEVKDLLKNKTFKIVLIFAVGAIGLYGTVRYFTHLREGTAKDLISKKLNLPSPVTKAIQHGLIRFSWERQSLQQVQALHQKGILTCVAQQTNSWWNNDSDYQIDITAQGRHYKLADSSDREGAKFYIMKLADKTLGDIKTIQESADARQAKVSFTILYKNFTPVGKVIGIEGLDLDKTSEIGSKKFTANFVKTNDGWQIDEDSSKDILEQIQ